MAVKQISIFVENKEGKLVTITDAIATAGIDIRAMSVADTQDFGIFRLIVTDPDKAKEALESSGCFVSITQVVGVSIPDEPGSLAKVVKILARYNINIEYMYAFIAVVIITAMMTYPVIMAVFCFLFFEEQAHHHQLIT